MDVHAVDVFDDASDRIVGALPLGFCSLQVTSNGVEDEGAGTAAGIEDAIRQRVVVDFFDHPLGKPIWCVVLAKLLSSLSRDD